MGKIFDEVGLALCWIMLGFVLGAFFMLIAKSGGIVCFQEGKPLCYLLK